MIKKDKALTILTDVVQNKKEHADYPRVTKYSELLKKIVTGEGQEDLLKRFNLREDAELFQQRKDLTITVTKPHAATAMKPVNKIPRVTPLINDILIEGDEKKAKELKEVIKTFYGGENLDTLLEKRFPDLNAYDPNAFFLDSLRGGDLLFAGHLLRTLQQHASVFNYPGRNQVSGFTARQHERESSRSHSRDCDEGRFRLCDLRG